jgi:hypothetical protein
MVHRSGPVRLLEVKPNKLPIVAVTGRIERPVDVPVRASDLWVVSHPDASRRLVEHIRVQEVARFVVAADLPQPIHEVAVGRVRIVQGRSHEIVGLFLA